MLETWKTFVSQQGAHIENDHVVYFDHTESRTVDITQTDILCDLSYLSCIRVSGEDAPSFLQNQLSNDVTAVTDSHWQFNSYNSPKGRMVACFNLFRVGDDYFIQLPNDIIHPAQQRLTMFVMRSKATLENVTNQYVSVGIAGPNVINQLNAANIPVPATPHDIAQQEDYCILRMPDASPRFILFGQIEQLQALWSQWRTNMQLTGANTWRLLNIRAGLPTIFDQTRETFIPQMVNYQAIDGISFNKGCYPGQEIVARMHYLGNLKKRMFMAHVETNIPPQPGDKVYSSDISHTQSIGNIVDAQQSIDNKVEALCVMQIKSTETNTVHLQDATGPRLDLQPLPYSLELTQT